MNVLLESLSLYIVLYFVISIKEYQYDLHYASVNDHDACRPTGN